MITMKTRANCSPTYSSPRAPTFPSKTLPMMTSGERSGGVLPPSFSPSCIPHATLPCRRCADAPRRRAWKGAPVGAVTKARASSALRMNSAATAALDSTSRIAIAKRPPRAPSCELVPFCVLFWRDSFVQRHSPINGAQAASTRIALHRRNSEGLCAKGVLKLRAGLAPLQPPTNARVA